MAPSAVDRRAIYQIIGAIIHSGLFSAVILQLGIKSNIVFQDGHRFPICVETIVSYIFFIEGGEDNTGRKESMTGPAM